MKRMKTFLLYLTLFILFYLFVNVMTYLNVRAAMKEMESNGIDFPNPIVTIEEAKASRVNAMIKGTMQKEADKTIQFQYIRVDFLSENDKILNSRYISVGDLADNEKQEFSIRTNTENVRKYRMTMTNIKEKSETRIKFQETELLIAGILLVWGLL